MKSPKSKVQGPKSCRNLHPNDRSYIVAQMSGLEDSAAARCAERLAKKFGISKKRVYELTVAVRPRKRRTRSDKKLLDGDLRRYMENADKTLADYDELIGLLQARMKDKKNTVEQHSRLTHQLRASERERLDLMHRIDYQKRMEQLSRQDACATEEEEPAPSIMEEFWRGYLREWVLEAPENVARLLGFQVARIHKKMLVHVATAKRPLTLAPRGFGKSTILTVTRAIHFVLKDHDIRVAIISETAHQARAFLYEIINILMTNEDLIWLFGKFYDGKTKWTEALITIAQRKRIFREGTIEAWGFDRAVVGRHFDVMLYDDPVSEENARTQYQQERLVKKYKTKFRPCLMPEGREEFVGTRYHFSDMYHTLIADAIVDSTLVLRAIENKSGREVSAWPGLFSIARLRKIRADLGSIIFNAQYQNDTDAMKGSIFKYHWMRFITRVEIPPLETLRIFQGVDLAIGTRETSDYFAHVTVAQDVRKKEWYVLDAYAQRLSFRQQTATIAQKFRQFDAIRVAIEANAYQAVMAQEARDSGVRVRQVMTHKDKVTRAMKLSGLFENGQIIFLKGLDALVNELLAFPGAEHDDLFDALDLAISTGKGSGPMVY